MIDWLIAGQPIHTGGHREGNRSLKAYDRRLSRWNARISFKKILQNDGNLALLETSLSLQGT